jgi:hypothetical protein
MKSTQECPHDGTRMNYEFSPGYNTDLYSCPDCGCWFETQQNTPEKEDKMHDKTENH